LQKKNAEEGNGSQQPPARLQRKVLKKVAFLESKFIFIPGYTAFHILKRGIIIAVFLSTELTANKPAKSTSAGVQKKKKRRPSVALSNFGSLAESLKEAAKKSEGGFSTKIPGASIGTLKARSRIA